MKKKESFWIQGLAFLAFACFVVNATIFVKNLGDCPKPNGNYEWNIKAGRWYWKSNNQKDYYQAKEECTSHNGGVLATMDNEYDADVAYDYYG